MNLSPRALSLTVLIGFLAAINVIGVQAGARLSNILTLAKLLPLFAVIVIGAIFLARNGPRRPRLSIPVSTYGSSHFCCSYSPTVDLKLLSHPWAKRAIRAAMPFSP